MDTLKQYAPLIAISISLIALLIAIYNATISKSSYNINRQQFKSKLSNFELYIIDSYSIPVQSERILIFHATITNKSESKNSFIPTLYLEYYNSEDVSVKFKLRHLPELSTKIKQQNFTFFPKDIFLSDKESISKWLIFCYDLDITKGKKIDKYTLNLRDVNSNVVENSIFLMKDLL
ncbi:hypothetical protein EON73_03420 [bacterium]|nr:MAG: hypothetical protein EON73_03420 [bacterium]